MRRSKVFVKKTKKGGIVKVDQEHYLRDDISCGSSLCTECPNVHMGEEVEEVEGENFADYGQGENGGSSSSNDKTQPKRKPLGKTGMSNKLFPKRHYLIPDTNVFLHQMDVMETPEIVDVIILQVVLEEVKHRNMMLYRRLRTMISNPKKRFYVFSNEHHRETYIERNEDESPNDRNDRAIRVTAEWYLKHMQPHGISVVMLSDDVGNRQKAQQMGISACSVQAYAEAISVQLADMVAAKSGLDTENTKTVFPEHMTQKQMEVGLKTGELFEGVFHITPYNLLEATVHSKDQVILIKGRENMNRAVHDDRVAVKLLPKEQWSVPSSSIVEEGEVVDKEVEAAKNLANAKPTGVVVGIVKRNWRPYCGSIDLPPNFKLSGHKSETMTFLPLDSKIPRIRIKSRQVETLVGQRIVVVIDDWKATSSYPLGHFVKALGPIGEKSTEAEVILIEYDVPHYPFPENILAELPSPNWDGDEEYRKNPGNRVDLRHLDVVSVDPPGCTDIDDALHIRPLPNGNLEIGVHIADVSHFVRPWHAMDKEASIRCTSVYLVEKRIDMLPELLGSNLCSIRSNVDRYVFSVIWEIDNDGNMLSDKFMKSIIRSRASLTYAEAQAMMDDKKINTPIAKGLRHLNRIAKILRAKRIEKGAIVLTSPQVRFTLENDSQDPVDVEMKELQEANAMIEEFMLLANISVARQIYSFYPQTALLRRHAAPQESRFEQLKNSLKEYGLDIDPTTSKTLADSLDAAVVPENPYFNTLIRILTTRCMTQAEYICAGNSENPQDFHHYGLATDIYTHFTSPIRRYADVIVHRQLAACISADEAFPELLDKNKIHERSDDMNRRHVKAQHSGRASVELFTLLFFKGKHLEEEGYVVRVFKNGFVVLIPQFGIEGVVYAGEPGKTPVLKFNPTELSLSYQSLKIRVFTKVRVQISVDENNIMRQKVRFALVDPYIPEISVESIFKKNIENTCFHRKKRRRGEHTDSEQEDDSGDGSDDSDN